MPVKCEDPGPCLVTSKIWGVDIPEYLCDLGACSNVMPYALYETMEKSKEVFTTIDASIMSVAEIAENVMITEIFHVTCPAAPWKKGAHQLRVGSKKIELEKLLRSEKRKESESPKNDAFIENGLRITPPQLKKKRKKVPLNLERKKEKKKKKQEEGKSEKKMVLQCSSFDKLLDKLKIFKKILHHHKSMDAHLVKDNSKWKLHKQLLNSAELRAQLHMEKEQKEAWKERKEENRATGQKQSYNNKNRVLTPWRHNPRLGMAELASYLSLIQHPTPRHDARRLGMDGSARKLALHQDLNA
ncbi:hypothetical protein PIB30_047459 [Stylosanthes scabra]|uniref:Uncharacterized protein n=1 Tax=Stylosanthes scabra TaxID=79078 RepID=A0ABU6YFI3_9FABA|nr:hypothetical protein [Stylosanthes scabra]